MKILLADAGVPMIFVTLPAMMYLIVPVIVIEFLAARRSLKLETTKSKWFGLTAANLTSTFLGWPLAWIVLVALQAMTGNGGIHRFHSPLAAILYIARQAPWLMPYEDQLYWMIPAAMAVLLIPFFFVSVFSERLILRFSWPREAPAELRRFSWIAHLWSYGFLLLVVIIYAIYSMRHK